MGVHFPAGWRCPEEMHELYPEVLKRMEGLIKTKARYVQRYTVPTLGVDDAIQEGRLALLAAMLRFEYNRSHGDLRRYVGRVLDNTFRGMITEALARSRMPRVTYMDGDTWAERPLAPMSMECVGDDGDEWRYEPESTYTTWEGCSAAPDLSDFWDEGCESIYADPERSLEERESLEQLRIFMMRFLNRTDRDSREYKVLECKVNPPIEFLVAVEDAGGDLHNPSNLHIAQYLNINKNQVDWVLRRIRSGLMRSIRQRSNYDLGVSELFCDQIGVRQGFAVVHISLEIGDWDFVTSTMATRGLDQKPIEVDWVHPNMVRECDGNAMSITKYSWGSVVCLECSAVSNGHRTLVIEGDFNPRSGLVKGASGISEDVPVSWYSMLMKSLLKGASDG